MGHDLDDEELKATKEKFYKSKENDKNQKYEIVFPLFSEEELKTIDLLIETDMSKTIQIVTSKVYHDRDLYILKKIIKRQQQEIQELKKENEDIWNHIPRLD